MKEIKRVLQKALAEKELSRQEIEVILTASKKEEQEEIFSAARRMRERYFSQKIFAYGFVYFSTYCRNNCNFCYYRRENKKSPRYRKNREEILEISRALTESGVHLLDITMGEDPLYYKKDDFSRLLEITRELKHISGLPVMASFGRVPDRILDELVDIGVDWYACYQETHNRDLFADLRVGQDYQSRLEIKQKAAKKGMLVEDGILLGVGESAADRAYSIQRMRELEVDQGRVMSFVPQKGTPMENTKIPGRINELLTIAALRLVLRDSLVPASLDVEGIEGLSSRLQAGANVVTSIIPPASGLKGVSNSELDIEEGRRNVQGVREELKQQDLKLAEAGEYKNWITSRKQRQRKGEVSWK